MALFNRLIKVIGIKNDNIENIDNFNSEWIRQARKLLKDNGTIWISGTHHNIFSIGQVLKENDFKILNMITWEKPNPPPNFSCVILLIQANG